MAYLLYTDVENFLNITLEAPGQSVVNEIILALTEYVDSYCNRTWSYGDDDEITETFDADSQIIRPIAVPVSEVISLTDDGVEIDSSLIYNYRTFLKIGAVLSGLPQGLELTYATSANVLPKDLKQALVMWAGQIFKSSTDGGKDVTRLSAGSVSVDYVASKEGVPPYVQNAMRKYRLVV